MNGRMTQLLVALAIMASLLLGARPLTLATASSATANETPANVAGTATAPTPPQPIVAPATAPATPADLTLGACRLADQRAACDAATRELAAYGLDIADVSGWTAFGLGRFVEAVERLADAFGGDGTRERRIAHFTGSLALGPGGGRVTVIWVGAPQRHNGSPMRGGYAADHLYFNPNTLFLDVDTADEARQRPAATIWWNYIHELAHLWDERSAPAAQDRFTAQMTRWVAAAQERGESVEVPSSYALIGGPAEAFADSVAATVTGDAANRDYYGSPRDTFLRDLFQVTAASGD